MAARFGREPSSAVGNERRRWSWATSGDTKFLFCLKALERATEAAIQRAARRS